MKLKKALSSIGELVAVVESCAIIYDTTIFGIIISQRDITFRNFGFGDSF